MGGQEPSAQFRTPTYSWTIILLHLLRNRKLHDEGIKEPLTRQFGAIFDDYRGFTSVKRLVLNEKLMMGFIWKDLISFSLCLFTFGSFVHVLQKYMSSNHRMSLKPCKKRKRDSLCCHSPMSMMIKRLVLNCWLKLCQDTRTALCACPIFDLVIMSHLNIKDALFLNPQGCSIKAKICFTKTVSAPKMPLVSCHLLFMNLVQRQMFHILIRKWP